MTRSEVRLLPHGFTAALMAGIAAAFLLAAAPAQAQRASVNSLAVDHDEILDTLGQGPTQISVCGTIATPGSYVVVQNLNAVGDCLTVTADNVTIDLGGHVLTGDGTGNGIGTDGTSSVPRLGIAVHHGTVTGFNRGIDFRSNARGSVIKHVRANDNNDTGIDAGVGGTVTGNTAFDNGDSGINAGTGSTITGNTAHDNGNHGIRAGNRSTVTGNTGHGNAGDGIRGGAGSTIAGNTGDGNGGNGIHAFAGSTVTGNTAEGNDGSGILALPAGGHTITGNTARLNVGDGIFVICPSNLIGNTAVGNSGVNLVLSGAGCNDIDNLAP